MKRVIAGCGIVAALCLALGAVPAGARSPVHPGDLPSGPLDGITDVRGVRVGEITKIEGNGALVPGRGPVRTGATGLIPNGDPWNERVAAATFDLNGNGEMTGSHWIDEAGFLETPIVFTDTLDVGRADDGVIDWMLGRYPRIGVRDDVPLPVVAECDDQGMNDIQGRHVAPSDVASMLASAGTGDFARGAAGAGTGMHAFGFKGGIGSSSRVLPRSRGGYTVGVLLNLNTGSRSELRVNGVAVGKRFEHELLPVYRSAYVPQTGRAADGSVVVAIATDAPLDALALREIAKRAVLGIARTGITSHVSSGDLFVAFSTTHVYPRGGAPRTEPPLVTDETTRDALFSATADAAETAVYDALFSARTMTGANGTTLYALPYGRVAPLLPH